MAIQPSLASQEVLQYFRGPMVPTYLYRLTGATLVALLLSLSNPSPAFAQDKKEIAGAKEHYRKGIKAYDLGDFEKAIREFQDAYELKDDPAYLYNLAQAYRRGGNLPKAISLYQTYLRKSPDAENKDEVEKRIVELQKAIAPPDKVRPPAGDDDGAKSSTPAPAQSQPAPVPVAPVPVSESTQDGAGWSGKAITGAIMSGAGGLSLVMGVTYTFVHESRANAFNAAGCSMVDGRAVGPSGCASKREGVMSARNVAISGYVAGAVLGGVGLYLLFTGDAGNTPKTARFSCAPDLGIGLNCGGTF